MRLPHERAYPLPRAPLLRRLRRYRRTPVSRPIEPMGARPKVKISGDLRDGEYDEWAECDEFEDVSEGLWVVADGDGSVLDGC